MKLKKNFIIVLSVIIAFSILFGYSNKSTAAQEESDQIYFKQVSFENNILVLSVNAKISEADYIQGTIMYDKTIKLTKVEYVGDSELSSCRTAVSPQLEKEGELIYYKDKTKKDYVFAFLATEGNLLSGDKTIYKLYFDISDCTKGKKYSIGWDTDNLSGSGNCTRTSKGDVQNNLNVSGFEFTLQDESEEEKAEREKQEAEKKAAEEAAKKAEQEAAEKKAAEEAAKKAEQEAAEKKAAEEAAKKAEQEAAEKKAAEEAAKKAEKEAAEKKAAEEAAKQQNKNQTINSTTENKAVNKAENTSTANTEKMPQTGDSSSFIIIGVIAFLVVFGAIGFEKARKLKFTK